MAASAAPRTESDRFERWLELIPHCNRAEEGIELDQLAALFDDPAEAILADVQALVDREYYLPGGFADSLTILIDGERLDLTSPDHFRRPVRLSPMEALGLQLGLQLERAEAEGGEEQTRISGLLASLLESAAPSGEEEGDEPASGSSLASMGAFSVTTGDTYEQLSEALRDRRVVELVYFKPYDCEEPKLRRLVPWALAEVYGNWYFLAEDLALREPRMFRLDRVLDVVITDTLCERQTDLAVEEYVDPLTVYRETEEDLTVGICYGPRIAPWIIERYREAEKRADGSAVVTHRCTSPWWVVTRGLSYGAEARIMDRDVVQLLKGSLQPMLAFG